LRQSFIYLKNKEHIAIAKSLDLSEILISSNVIISDTFDEEHLFNSNEKVIGIKITKDNGKKCPRCWRLVKEFNSEIDLCFRCFAVINEN